jgi:hypothetical protein
MRRLAAAHITKTDELALQKLMNLNDQPRVELGQG